MVVQEGRGPSREYPKEKKKSLSPERRSGRKKREGLREQCTEQFGFGRKKGTSLFRCSKALKKKGRGTKRLGRAAEPGLQENRRSPDPATKGRRNGLGDGHRGSLRVETVRKPGAR